MTTMLIMGFDGGGDGGMHLVEAEALAAEFQP